VQIYEFGFYIYCPSSVDRFLGVCTTTVLLGWRKTLDQNFVNTFLSFITHTIRTKFVFSTFWPRTTLSRQAKAKVRLRNDLYCVEWGVKLY